MSYILDKLFFENIYPVKLTKLTYLYDLLHEREEYESISHTGMPTFEEHRAFVNRVPYKEWYLVYLKNDNGFIDFMDPVGSYYLTYKNEIGIAVFKKHRRKGYAKAIIEEIIFRHPKEDLYANINPNNLKSINLFKDKFNFRHIQNTYKLHNKEEK